MLEKELPFLFKVASASAERSHAVRSKVGAVIVDSFGRIISTGYNGTHNGADNCCEEVVVLSADKTELKTLDTVIHAEENAMLHAAKRGLPLENAIMITTLSPCIKCCSRMIQAGILRAIYKEEYRLHNEVLDKMGKFIYFRHYKETSV